MKKTLKTWLKTSLNRHFPGTPVQPNRSLTLEVAGNERFSFQLGMRRVEAENEPVPRPVEVRVAVRGPKEWKLRVRRIGYVPVPHHNWQAPPGEIDGFDRIPGYVPDPLFDGDTLRLPARETHAFWISVIPRRKIKPGSHRISVAVYAEGKLLRRHVFTVNVADVTLRQRRGFRVSNWFYCDALLDYYGMEAFEPRFWEMLPRYLKNLSEHGQDTLYVPLLTPSLDGVKRPTQLLRVFREGKDRYRFDWRDVRRFLKTARNCGLRYFEWPHLFTQWGVERAVRVYEGQGKEEKLLWSAGEAATSPVYRRFLEQLLPALHRFLVKEGLAGRSFFHLSDEPRGHHLDNYRAARSMVKEIAPWMNIMDAISDINFAREGLTDTPVAAINHALPFVEEGIQGWCYYCCSQRGSHVTRLLDTPLPKIRMNGWLFYRWPFQGFLHWGANYWYRSQTRELIDPFTVHDGHGWPNWPCGDTFMLYPGPEGPNDSLRWEIFAESLQDYALLQAAGVDREDRLLASLASFTDFPKSETWIRSARRRLLRRAEKRGCC